MLNNQNKCRNLAYDSKKNEYYCKSIHVCYKKWCLPPTMFDDGITHSNGKLIFKQ